MSTLVYIEMFKRLKKTNVKIFVVILFVLMLIGIGTSIGGSLSEDEWRATAEKKYQECSQRLKKDKQDLEEASDESIKQIVQINIDMHQEEVDKLGYALEHNIPVGIDNAITYLGDSIIFAHLILLFVMIMTIQSVQDEYSYGTIKQLFIQPVKRIQIMISKYISNTLIATVLFLAFMALSYILALLFLGNAGGGVELAYIDGKVVEQSVLRNILLNYTSLYIQMLTVMFIVFLLSNIFVKTVIPLLTGIVLWLGNTLVYGLIDKLPGSRFTIFPNIQLSQYIDCKESALTGNTIEISIAVICVHIVLSFILSIILAKKKELY